jgi:hypothetical protein
MSVRQAARGNELRLARDKLARIERQIGTGSARTNEGRWSRARARSLNRLRHDQAACKARLALLEKAAA